MACQLPRVENGVDRIVMDLDRVLGAALVDHVGQDALDQVVNLVANVGPLL